MKKNEKFTPDAVTYTIMIPLMQKLGSERLKSFLQEVNIIIFPLFLFSKIQKKKYKKKKIEKILQKTIKIDNYTVNTILGACVEIKERKITKQIFNKAKEDGVCDIITYTIMFKSEAMDQNTSIQGKKKFPFLFFFFIFSKKKKKKIDRAQSIQNLFEEMINSNIQPTQSAMKELSHIATKLRSEDFAMWIHEQMKVHEIPTNPDIIKFLKYACEGTRNKKALRFIEHITPLEKYQSSPSEKVSQKIEEEDDVDFIKLK